MAKTPPEDADAATSEETPRAAEAPRTGLPDWLWASVLTAAIAALLLVVGAGTFAA